MSGCELSSAVQLLLFHSFIEIELTSRTLQAIRVCSSVALVQSVQPRLQSVLGHFCHHEKKPGAPQSASPPFSNPRQPLISLYLLWTFHVNGLYVVILCLWSFALSLSMFSRFIHVVACICCIPFYDWMLFHSMDRRHFVYLLVCWWTFGLATMGNAAVNICVQISVWV